MLTGCLILGPGSECIAPQLLTQFFGCRHLLCAPAVFLAQAVYHLDGAVSYGDQHCMGQAQEQAMVNHAGHLLQFAVEAPGVER